MLLITLGYIFLGLSILVTEKVRIRNYGPDLFTFFIFMLVVQLVLPGAFLTAMKGFGEEIDVGVPFFTNVLNDLGVYEATLTFVLLLLFVFCLYVFWAIINNTVNLQRSSVSEIRISVSHLRWSLIMILGLIGMWVLVSELGSYNNLVLFRIDRTRWNDNFVVANLFSSTMTFLMLSIVGVLIFWESKTSIKFLFSLACLVVFSIMTVSRRPFVIAPLLIFFTLVFNKNKIYINKKMFIIFLAIFIPIIIFGKSILWLLAHHSDITVAAISSGNKDLLSGVTLIMSNIGISTIESWATLLYLDIPMRFGVDHLLSIARRIPDGMLGLDIDFPERMVRISTKAFVGAGRQDIPPGFIGQMWLDFRLFGPVLSSMAFCFMISVLQILYNRVCKDRAAISLFVLLIYTISLPVRSGTLDFVFSVNVFLLIILMAFIVRIKIRKVVT